MELAVTDSSTIPWVRYHAAQTFDLVRGQGLKIKTTGPPADLLDIDVPAKKKWTVCVHVSVEETDV